MILFAINLTLNKLSFKKLYASGKQYSIYKYQYSAVACSSGSFPNIFINPFAGMVLQKFQSQSSGIAEYNVVPPSLINSIKQDFFLSSNLIMINGRT
jgi:hypothetical protein